MLPVAASPREINSEWPQRQALSLFVPFVVFVVKILTASRQAAATI